MIWKIIVYFTFILLEICEFEIFSLKTAYARNHIAIQQWIVEIYKNQLHCHHYAQLLLRWLEIIDEKFEFHLWLDYLHNNL